MIFLYEHVYARNTTRTHMYLIKCKIFIIHADFVFSEIDINIGSSTSILWRVGIVMSRNKRLKYAYIYVLYTRM